MLAEADPWMWTTIFSGSPPRRLQDPPDARWYRAGPHLQLPRDQDPFWRALWAQPCASHETCSPVARQAPEDSLILADAGKWVQGELARTLFFLRWPFYLLRDRRPMS